MPDFKTSCLVVLGAASLAGCATPTAGPPHEGRPDAVIRIDARPGEFQLYRASLDAKPGSLPEPIRFAFELKQLQPAEQWIPTLNLCTYVGAETQVHCIQVVKRSTIEHLIPTTQMKADADSDIKSGETNYYLARNARHTLDVVFTQGRVTFSIDGRLVGEQPAAATPDAYYVSCSSAVCEVAVYQPPGRP